MKDNGFDFKDCDFINSEMKFYSFADFYANCYAIRRLFDSRLSKYGKIFYKWYVYSNVYTTMKEKNIIWDYLNHYVNKDELKRKY